MNDYLPWILGLAAAQFGLFAIVLRSARRAARRRQPEAGPLYIAPSFATARRLEFLVRSFERLKSHKPKRADLRLIRLL
jgi:hypothetical protein